MSLIENIFIERFTKNRFEGGNFSDLDCQSLEKIKTFIEKTPQVINELIPSAQSVKNLFSNLSELLQEKPSCKDIIVKIKKVALSTLVKKDIDAFFLNLDRYKDLDPVHLRELIGIAVEVFYKDFSSTSHLGEKIKKYGIKEEKIRIEIARSAAACDGRGTSKCIGSYAIKDQKALIEIAIIASNQNGLKTSKYIKNYGIKDPDARIGIAMIAASRLEGGISKYIQSYGIKDQDALIEIARIAVTNFGRDTSQHIGNYGIKDEKALVEIAKISASRFGRETSEYIGKYSIKDPAALIEIAKISAAQDGGGTSEYIGNYGIKDEKALIEIARIAAVSDGHGTSQHILKYGIKDQLALIEIATIIVPEFSTVILKYLPNFFRTLPSKNIPAYQLLLFKALVYGLSETRSKSNPLTIFKDFEKFGPLLPNKVTLTNMEGESFLKDCIKSFEDPLPPVLQKISPCKEALKYRNKQLAYPLIDTFISESFNPAYQEAYTSLAKTTPAYLPSVLPSKWMAQANIKNPPEGLSNFLSRFKPQLKNKDTGLMQMCLLTTQTLDKFEGISPERKLALLSSVCNQPKGELQKVFEGLGYLYSFCIRNQINVLNTLDLKAPITSSKEALEKLLTKDSLVKISDISNFAALYGDSFNHTRIPLAIEIYKAKLSTLNDEATRSTLERFIRSVLLKTFDEERFRTDISPHLAKIEAHYPKVLSRWKSLTFSASLCSSTIETEQPPFSFRSFFDLKLYDKHWNNNGKDLLPDLTSYLKGEEIKNPSHPILTLCKELIENESFSKIKQIEKIQQILKALATSALRESELNNDLNGLLQTLESEPQASLNETVILTKDWQDLLLAGSEVAGSCQRIDGLPSLNKCLLAYCMDGKNAMIGVRNKDGKILARSMLRLLWNEKKQRPALFLDRLYPPLLCPPEKQEAIVTAAKECAKDLNCDLFTLWSGYPETPGTTIKSLKGPCPYEYEDAANGVNPNGIFEIKNLREVYLTV